MDHQDFVVTSADQERQVLLVTAGRVESKEMPEMLDSPATQANQEAKAHKDQQAHCSQAPSHHQAAQDQLVQREVSDKQEHLVRPEKMVTMEHQEPMVIREPLAHRDPWAPQDLEEMTETMVHLEVATNAHRHVWRQDIRSSDTHVCVATLLIPLSLASRK